MYSIYLVAATLVAAQCKADVPANGITELLKESQAKIDQAMDNLKKQVGLSQNPDGAEIVKLVQQQNEKMVATLKETSKKLEEHVSSTPELNEAVKNVKSKLDEFSKSLQEKAPGVFENAGKYGDEMKVSWEKFTTNLEEEYKTFSKAGGKKEEIEDFFKNLFDKGVAVAKELQTQVEDAMRKKE